MKTRVRYYNPVVFVATTIYTIYYCAVVMSKPYVPTVDMLLHTSLYIYIYGRPPEVRPRPDARVRPVESWCNMWLMSIAMPLRVISLTALRYMKLANPHT